jgi:RNA polymerase sigma factor (sigma-70 family)
MPGPLEQLRVVLQPHASGSDAQLLEWFVEDETSSAFTELVRRHGPMVFGVCRRILRHHQEAEDAFQAVFLVLAQKARSIWPREQLPQWLYRVAYHTALKARERMRRRQAREACVPLPEPAVMDRGAESAEWKAILDEELQHLPQKYRALVILCGLEGQPRRAVATLLGLPEGTVAGRWFRARQMLADRLSRRGITLSVDACTVGLLAGPKPQTSLVAGTVRLVRVASLGEAGVAVPHSIHLLSQEVVQAMSLSKWKLALICCLCVLTMSVGVGYFGPTLAWSEEREPSKEQRGHPGQAQRPEQEPLDPELVLQKRVQKELRLSENQIHKLQQAWEAGKEKAADEEQRREELNQQIEALEKKLAALRGQQHALAARVKQAQKDSLKQAILAHVSNRGIQRLRQLTLRQMSLRQLLQDPRIQARLNITDEQLKKLDALPAFANRIPRFDDTLRVQKPDAEVFWFKAMDAREFLLQFHRDDEVLKILTPEQQKAWKAMLGEPSPRPQPGSGK